MEIKDDGSNKQNSRTSFKVELRCTRVGLQVPSYSVDMKLIVELVVHSLQRPTHLTRMITRHKKDFEPTASSTHISKVSLAVCP